MIRCGLPTQEEINRWDDHQRATGRQMVRVLSRKEVIRRRLERAGYREIETRWVIPMEEAKAYALSPSGKWFVGFGESEVEALADLAGELGVRV